MTEQISRPEIEDDVNRGKDEYLESLPHENVALKERKEPPPHQ
jgi:hypothetical protein